MRTILNSPQYTIQACLHARKASPRIYATSSTCQLAKTGNRIQKQPHTVDVRPQP